MAKVFDYLIVGAGSAGCVLANRLSEDINCSVLLLEAGGPDKKSAIHIPAAFSKLFKSELDWNYLTQEQKHLNNRRLYWPRGRVWGGSSSINAMIYIRGNPFDYDHWRDLGNDGWGYSDLLPYFKRSEHQGRGAAPYHGIDGPLYVSNLRTINPLSEAFVNAGIEIGLAHNSDFNDERQTGVGIYQVTQKEGERHSAASAYLRPAKGRSNLKINSDSLATRILFKGQQAVGVEYLQYESTHQVYAEREVILCGGALNSPQLLLLSGIGPRDHLQELGIAVVHDLAGVGQNLQDHLAVPVAYQCRAPISLHGAETLSSFIKYLIAKRGPLTSNVAEAGGFVKTRPELDAPDLQFHFAPVFFSNHGFTKYDGHAFTFGPTLVQPGSRGVIRLRSRNPLEHPVIQPNYLERDEDLQVLVHGVELARKMAQTAAFEKYRGAEIMPGSQAQNRSEIEAYIRRSAETIYHPVGTCKMGSDPMAVVDSRLRVHGIERLRVVDASIMPRITRGNTNAPTIMIAEKAADLIKNR
ncbi:choline dehydrogenase [Candidatus Acetothermia bacterium]|nr:choline dehydrogenase [Candidatus Acetothermia bacterium]MBI3643623.1 choline dehydrogenase [Candidatus Acetothermia bacterium]